jgi:hypothetical protein
MQKFANIVGETFDLSANEKLPTLRGAGRHSVRGHLLPSLYRMTILHENSVLQIS